jgi:hypothetical protein
MKSLPLIAGAGAGIGALYGLGESSGKFNAMPHTTNRALQGGASALAGTALYQSLRNGGYGAARSGLLGLLSAGAIAALTNPALPQQRYNSLPF